LQGQKICDPAYSAFKPYAQDLIIVANDGKKGALNESGKVIIPLEKQNIQVAYSDKLIMAQKDKTTWEFYDLTGKLLFTKACADVQGANEGIISIVNDKKQVGFIDMTGKDIAAPAYKKAFDFSEGQTLVKTQDGKLQLLNKDGKVVANLPGKDLGTAFSEGVASVRDGNNFTGIDHTGKALFAVKAVNMAPFHDGVASIERKVSKMNVAGLAAGLFSAAITGGTSFCIGGDGSVSFGGGLFDPYYYPGDHYHYHSGVYTDLLFEINYKDYKLGYINTKGEEIIPTKNDFNSPVKDKRILVKVKDKYGYVDTTGAILVPAEFDDISYFTPTDNDVVAVGKDEKYAFYKIGQGVASRWYAKVKPYSEGLAAVDLGEDNWVYINRQGNRIGQVVKYKSATDYSEGVATVGIGDNKLAVLDAAGNKILDTTTDYKVIDACHKGLIPVQDKTGKWGFLDKKGQVLVQSGYDAYRFGAV
jgi:hypothetical protein